MGNGTNGQALAPVQRLKQIISSDSVQEQFRNALAENSGLFTASLIDIYGSDTYLQRCDPKSVVMEALKAATLKLPINKGLGFAYIVPYKDRPTMQIGYRGYIQLAQRTGQYRYINADAVYKGESVQTNRLTGEVAITGEPETEDAIGYFAYIETVTGFKKALYWTKEKVFAHAKKYSASFSASSSPWKSHFDEMAIKTVLRNLLSKYGTMSVEMVAAINSEEETDPRFEAEQNANSEVIDVEFKESKVEPEPKAETKKTGPDF